LEADLHQKTSEVENLKRTIAQVTEESAQKDQKLQLLQSKIDEIIQTKLGT